MLMDFVWNVFKTTGSIDSYVFMKEIEEKYKLEPERDESQEEATIS